MSITFHGFPQFSIHSHKFAYIPINFHNSHKPFQILDNLSTLCIIPTDIFTHTSVHMSTHISTHAPDYMSTRISS